MTDTRVHGAAQALIEARRSQRQIAFLPEDCRPQSAIEAYAIQDLVALELGGVGGWKVGAKSPAATPTCAPLLSNLILRAGDGRDLAPGRKVEVEGEIACVLARDLPLRSSPYSASELAEALDSMHTSIEVIDSRYSDWRSVDPLSSLADMLNNGALVLGAGQAATTRLDQVRERAWLSIGDVTVADHIGANTAGDVYRLLAWLANHLAERCGGLRAGQVVTTGTCTGIAAVHGPARIAARVGPLNAAELTLR